MKYKIENVYYGDLYDRHFLYHHGILGQKWGVRRYQNKDGTLTAAGRKHLGYGMQKFSKKELSTKRSIENLEEKTIPAGTKVYRISGSEDASGITYVTSSEPDRNLYKGHPSILANYRNGNGDLTEYEYSLKQDVKVCSAKEADEALFKVLNDNPQFITTIADKRIRHLNATNPISDDAYKMGMSKDFSEPKSPAEYDKLIKNIQKKYNLKDESSAEYFYEDAKYVNNGFKSVTKEILNQSAAGAYIATGYLGASKQIREALSKELSSRGYNAMYDVATINPDRGRNEKVAGHESLIVFDGGSSLSNTGSEKLTRKSVTAAQKDYDKWYKRVNGVKDTLGKDREWLSSH